MSVMVNMMLFLMSVMNPSLLLCNQSVLSTAYCGILVPWKLEDFMSFVSWIMIMLAWKRHSNHL